MQLFEKWQSRAFGIRSINILKAFLRSNTEIINAQCGLDKNIEKVLSILSLGFF
ncbi:hypothetical protein CHC151_14050 [Helicobacter pylori]